jgi:hypothetical protein
VANHALIAEFAADLPPEHWFRITGYHLFITKIFNSNPHCFIAITKLWLEDEKAHFSSTPCTVHSPVEGGAGGCLVWSPEDLLLIRLVFFLFTCSGK